MIFHFRFAICHLLLEATESQPITNDKSQMENGKSSLTREPKHPCLPLSSGGLLFPAQRHAGKDACAPRSQKSSRGLDFCLFAVDTCRVVRHSNPNRLSIIWIEVGFELSGIHGLRVLRFISSQPRGMIIE
jgi:hypothetical protein